MAYVFPMFRIPLPRGAEEEEKKEEDEKEERQDVRVAEKFEVEELHIINKVNLLSFIFH